MELPDAVELLESDPELGWVSVDAARDSSDDDEVDGWDGGGGGGVRQPMFPWYPRFVDALEQHPRVEGIHLINFRFDGRRRRLLLDHHDDDNNHNHNNHLLSIIAAIRLCWGGLWRDGGNEPPRGAPPPLLPVRAAPPAQLLPVPLPLPPLENPVTLAADHLFGAVLPCHRTLRTIRLENCRVDARHMEAFFENLPLPASASSSISSSSSLPPSVDRNSPRRLELCLASPAVDPLCFPVVADALGQDAPLLDLKVVACWLPDPQCYQRICDGAALNRHLVSLCLFDIRFLPPTTVDDAARAGAEVVVVSAAAALCNLLGPSSTVRQLVLSDAYKCWDPHFVEDMVRMLRTNVVLTSLRCHGLNKTSDYGMFLDLVSTYNFTLQYLDLVGSDPDPDPDTDDNVDGDLDEARARVARTMSRNDRVWASYDHMRRNGVPEIVHDRDGDDDDDDDDDERNRCRLWPEAIARINPFPTLLYRFLRKNSGNAASLVEYLQKAGQTSRNSTGKTANEERSGIEQ